MIEFHAVTKVGQLATRDIERFPIPEGSGLCKLRKTDRGREGLGNSGNLCEVPPGDFLGQEKHVKDDYQGAMTDKIFFD